MSGEANRASPLAGWYGAFGAGQTVLEGMALPASLNASVPRGEAVRLRDLSWRRRFGCKGPGADAWLARSGFTVPRDANQFAVADGVLVARLGSTEFMVEAVDAGSPAFQAADRQLRSPECPSTVYPVARLDFAMEAKGPALVDFLRQTCSVDFAPILAAAQPAGGVVTYTSMIGVGTQILAGRDAHSAGVTIWSDPSFAYYFWTTLLEVGADLGGGVTTAA